MTKLPLWIAIHQQQKESQEVQEYATLTPEERLARFAQVVQLSWALFSQNKEQQTALALREERSPESMKLWQSLMKQRPYRG